MPDFQRRNKKTGKNYADYLAESQDPIYQPYKQRLEYNSFGWKFKGQSYEPS